MNSLRLAIFAVALPVFTFNQQVAAAQSAPDEKVNVYAARGNVSAPELLLIDFSKAITRDCRNSESGETELAFIVDSTGQARNLVFLHPAGNDLDKMALVVLHADRFSPGKLDGAPVAVGQSVKINLEICYQIAQTDNGQTTTNLRLHSQPEQRFGQYPDPPSEAILAPADASKLYRVGGGVRAPVPIYSPQADFTDGARRAKYQGVCLLSLVVDAEGMPQNPRVVRPLGLGLDEKALEAVRTWRFKPATLNGLQPVKIMITVEFNFRL